MTEGTECLTLRQALGNSANTSLHADTILHDHQLCRQPNNSFHFLKTDSYLLSSHSKDYLHYLAKCLIWSASIFHG